MREFLKEWFAYGITATLLTGWGPLQIWRVPVGPLNRPPVQLYPNQPDMGQAELLSRSAAVPTPGALKLEMAQIYERGRLFKQARRLYEEVIRESHHPAEVAVARESQDRLGQGIFYPRREIYPTFQAVERTVQASRQNPIQEQPSYSPAAVPAPLDLAAAPPQPSPAPLLPAAVSPAARRPGTPQLLPLLQSFSTLPFQIFSDRVRGLLKTLGLPEVTRIYTELEIQNFSRRQIEPRFLKQVTDIEIKIHPGLVDSSGTAHVGPLELLLRAEIGISAPAGFLQLEIRSIHIGSTPLPEPLCRLLESGANESLNRNMGSLQFTRFELKEGYLIATLSDVSQTADFDVSRNPLQ
ncbi:MAG: hypothetical protein HY594_02435 [Candidatus Omnitrophica bacterium]|nr:hypothetical protein [Candidatus Omnitrophota bacterium]